MYSVLVLGLIPGTHIQISFQAWLAVTAIVLLVANLAWLEHKRHQNELWLPPHYPKHASQLHQRVV